MSLGFVEERGLVGGVAVAEAHDRDHLVSPALARPAGHDAVVHRRVGLDRALDLLGEDLLAAGVDRHRVAAVQFDHPVGAQAGPIAGDRVAHTVDDRVGP